MAKAASADVRAWAAQNGHPELAGGRGRLGNDVWAAYEAAHIPPADGYGPGTGPEDFEDPDGDLPFVEAEAPPEPPAPPPPPPPGQQEERPQRPRTARPKFGWPGFTKGGSRRKARKVWKRISVAPLIEDAYADLAGAFGGIPPMARLLKAQAPLAGVVLDPVVKDTVADRIVLQPVARNYERVKVATGLLGPPAALMAVLVTAPRPAGQREVIGPDGQPVYDAATGHPVVELVYEEPSLQHKTAMVGLRYTVRAMADAAGDAMTRVIERAEVSEERDRLVDEFLAYVLGMPYHPDAADERESEQARQAGLKLAGAAAS